MYLSVLAVVFLGRYDKIMLLENMIGKNFNCPQIVLLAFCVT